MEHLGRLALAVTLCTMGCAGADRANRKVAPTPVAPRLATIAIPGDPAFVAIARDVTGVVFAIDPSTAAGAGLFDDALQVPSFSPATIAALTARLDRDLAALRAMPWRTWPIDTQIDLRWIYANAETARHQLVDERLFVHRPASWLEPLSNQLIAFASYAPDDRARPARIWAAVPAMLDEMRAVATAVTQRDQETARKLIGALVAMARADGSAAGTAAVVALTRYDDELAALHPSRELDVIGAAGFAWRLAHAELVDQTTAQLLATARTELARVDGERTALAPQLPPAPEPTAAQTARAQALTRDKLLAVYDGIETDLRAATLAGDFVTIPASVGPIHARETPDAMVPLTGDGGSMNPPPTYVADNIGYWNVEHFHADWDLKRRLEEIVDADLWKIRFGPYAAHEGFPGHHLQLAIARLHPDPIRSILADGMQNEGWGLYAEEELWRHGGLGDSPAAHDGMLRSYRFRILRVVYDIQLETGAWSLQQAADFQQSTPAGQGTINEDLLRAIQWPTQLLHYFTGKQQILALRAEYQKKLGTKYTDRAFHDAFLAEGSIPVPLIRAKLLGTPVPDL